jgi:heme oxygenase (mycobilin-producing)
MWRAKMSHTATFEVQLGPAALAGATRILIDSLAATVAFDGFQSHEVLVDDADPTRVVVPQRWSLADIGWPLLRTR